MAAKVEDSNGIEIISDMNTRISDIDEKHSLLKEKTLLLGQSFLKQEEGSQKDIAMIKG